MYGSEQNAYKFKYERYFKEFLGQRNIKDDKIHVDDKLDYTRWKCIVVSQDQMESKKNSPKQIELLLSNRANLKMKKIQCHTSKSNRLTILFPFYAIITFYSYTISSRKGYLFLTKVGPF